MDRDWSPKASYVLSPLAAPTYVREVFKELLEHKSTWKHVIDLIRKKLTVITELWMKEVGAWNNRESIIVCEGDGATLSESAV